jgi:hypothetical protein
VTRAGDGTTGEDCPAGAAAAASRPPRGTQSFGARKRLHKHIQRARAAGIALGPVWLPVATCHSLCRGAVYHYHAPWGATSPKTSIRLFSCLDASTLTSNLCSVLALSPRPLLYCISPVSTPRTHAGSSVRMHTRVRGREPGKGGQERSPRISTGLQSLPAGWRWW